LFILKVMVSTTSILYQSVHYMIVRWPCFCIADVRRLCCSEFLIVCYLIMNWSDLLDCWKPSTLHRKILYVPKFKDLQTFIIISKYVTYYKKYRTIITFPEQLDFQQSSRWRVEGWVWACFAIIKNMTGTIIHTCFVYP
jgi:hypothetical protein